MDIDLGKISGISAVKHLKKQFPNIQFMMCTVHEEADQIFEAIKRKKKVVYVSKRWKLIGILLKIISW